MNRTLQQIFDEGLAHLRKQGVPALDPETVSCLYRGPNNTSCFFGGLIPDDKYDPNFEEAKASIVRDAIDADPAIPGATLDAMQTELHDGPAMAYDGFLEHVERNAKRFALEYGLIYTAPETGA